MGKLTGKFEIDWDTADQITLQSLKAHLEILKEDLKKLKESESPGPERLAELKETIYVFKHVVKYYGG